MPAVQVQDDVQSSMRRLQRPITFSDLAHVWTGTNKDRNARSHQDQGPYVIDVFRLVHALIR